jgi:hypothetical protein
MDLSDDFHIITLVIASLPNTIRYQIEIHRIPVWFQLVTLNAGVLSAVI